MRMYFLNLLEGQALTGMRGIQDLKPPRVRSALRKSSEDYSYNLAKKRSAGKSPARVRLRFRKFVWDRNSSNSRGSAEKNAEDVPKVQAAVCGRNYEGG